MAIRTTNSLNVVEWGVAARPHSGPGAFGDLHLVAAFTNGLLMAVVDGLGHGNQAAVAARTAVSVLRRHASDSVVSLIKRCHRALMMSRGAVMTLGRLDLHSEKLSWVGVGNVEGVLLRADAAAIPASERVRLHGGVVGYKLPKLQASELSIFKGDLIVFATDGINSDFTHDLRADGSPQQTANHVLERHFKGGDDALVFALRYLGGRQ